MELEPGYSIVADEQLDAIQDSVNLGLYDDVVVVCEAILDDPGRARLVSATVLTDHGVVFRFAVPGRAPLTVFWSSAGPTVEALFPYPS